MLFFFLQAEDGIRDGRVTGVQTCALPICLATAGQGIKIGLIDDGIDQAHPYFNPSGFSYPAGFPKGNTAYTTPKVKIGRASCRERVEIIADSVLFFVVKYSGE